jgi:hypothetical protein
MTILSKWEWIASKLFQMGHANLAADAVDIEHELKKLYGNTITPCWANAYPTIEEQYNKKSDDFQRMRSVCNTVLDASYCIGCFRTTGDIFSPSDAQCEQCDFGKKMGFCKKHGSKFAVFFRKVAKEADLYTQKELTRTAAMS